MVHKFSQGQGDDFRPLFEGVHTLLHNREVPRLRQLERDYYPFDPRHCPEADKPAFDLLEVGFSALQTAAAKDKPGEQRTLMERIRDGALVIHNAILRVWESPKSAVDWTQAAKRMKFRSETPEARIERREQLFMATFLALLDEAGYELVSEDEINYGQLHNHSVRIRVNWDWLDDGLQRRSTPYAGMDYREPRQFRGKVLVAVRDRGEISTEGYFPVSKFEARVHELTQRLFLQPLASRFPRAMEYFWPGSGLLLRHRQTLQSGPLPRDVLRPLRVAGTKHNCDGLYKPTGAARNGRPVWRRVPAEDGEDAVKHRKPGHDELYPREIWATSDGRWLIGLGRGTSTGWIVSKEAAASPGQVEHWLQLTDSIWRAPGRSVAVTLAPVPGMQPGARHPVSLSSFEIGEDEFLHQSVASKAVLGAQLHLARLWDKVELREPTRRSTLLLFRRKREWHISKNSGEAVWRAGGGRWNPHNIEVSSYEEVPLVDLETLMPEKDTRYRPLDVLSQGIAIAIIAFNLARGYFEPLSLASIAVLGAAGTYSMRLYHQKRNTKMRYLSMADTLRSRGLVGTGQYVMRHLVYTATQQRLKAALIVYTSLLKGGADAPRWTAADLDRQSWHLLQQFRQAGLRVGDARLPPGRLAQLALDTSPSALGSLELWQRVEDRSELPKDALGLQAVDPAVALIHIRRMVASSVGTAG